MKLFLRKFSALAFSLSLVLFLFVNVAEVNATNPSAISDTMTRQKVSVASSHTIIFTMSAAVSFDTGDTITYDFGTPGFTLAAATTSDVSFNDGSARTVINAGNGAQTCTSGVNNVTVRTETSTGLITITACPTYTSSATGATVTFKIGVVAGGTDRLTNPGSNGSKKVPLAGSYGDAAISFAVPILTDDQVVVSATVDPTITSTLSATTCALGTLSSSAVGFCSYTNTVSTNAGSGYASTIVDNGASVGKLCSPSVGTCTNNIPVELGNNQIDQGTSEYGVGTSKTSQTITHYTTCANNNPQPAKALSGTAQQYASATGPVSSDVTTLCHAASISGVTPAGNYTGTVTHITTGTF